MHTHETVDYRAAHLKEAGYPVEKAHHMYRCFPSWSVFCDGILVMSGGFVVPYEGLAEAWAIPGPAFARHHKLALRETRAALDHLLPPGTRRLQALVINSHDAGHRWCQHIGLSLESVMPKYGKQGEAVAMYVAFPGRNTWTAE